MLAGPDGVGLANEMAWCVSAEPDPNMDEPYCHDRQRGELVGFRSLSDMAPIVENLALMVAAGNWLDPPPEPKGIGERGTQRWFRSLGRAKAARQLDQGAGAEVRVIDLSKTAAAGRRAGEDGDHRTVASHARRGHWRRVRLATRDVHSNIVGNVHGDQGSDWHYQPIWVPPTVIHPDLSSEGSGARQVWRLPTP